MFLVDRFHLSLPAVRELLFQVHTCLEQTLVSGALRKAMVEHCLHARRRVIKGLQVACSRKRRQIGQGHSMAFDPI